MKRGIITLLSVLAISLAFTGCGEEGSYTENGASAGSTGSTGTVVASGQGAVEQVDSVDAYISELGIGEKLGVPPVRP